MSEEPNTPGAEFFAGVNKELQERQDKESLEEAELFDDDFGDGDDLIVVGEAKPETSAKSEPEQPEPADDKAKAKAEKAKFKEQILVSLGFRCYDNGDEGRKYTMMLHYKDADLKLGKTFKLNGSHFWWAYAKDSTPEDPDRMMPSKQIAEIPVVHLYIEILNNVVKMPSKEVVGHVHKRHGHSLLIEFDVPEAYEEKGASFGEGAVKSDVNGKFIAASFSAATKNQLAKMKVPRVIRLPNYDAEIDTAPKSTPQTKDDKLIGGHIPLSSSENPNSEEEAEIAAEMADDIIRMRLSVRAAVEITTGEVDGKIDNQGLAGFVNGIAVALFREPRLEAGLVAQRGKVASKQ